MPPIYLALLQTNDPNNAALAEVSRELTGKLLERARAAVAAGKPADADLALAKRWGADPKDIIAVQQAQNAPKAQAAIDPAILAASLKRLRAPSPDYPQSALAQKISGQRDVAVHGRAPTARRVMSAWWKRPPRGCSTSAATECHQTLALRARLSSTAPPSRCRCETLMRFELPK